MQITICEAPFYTVSLQPAPFFLLEISTLLSYLFSDHTVYILPVQCEKTFHRNRLFPGLYNLCNLDRDKTEVIFVHTVKLYGIL